MGVDAIIWDYDGTLVDSARKNMAVTVEVLRHFDQEIELHLPDALKSYENYSLANHTYKNWRDLYKNSFNIREEDLDEAGKLWTPEQCKNKIIPDFFSGMEDLLHKMKPIKMGICSQNSSKNIEDTLRHYGVADCFEMLIGVDEVSGKEQKPHPAGFIKCLQGLRVPIGEANVIYIGDHSEDVVFGKNAQEQFREDGLRVICIGVDFLQQEHLGVWKMEPDYRAKSVGELHTILFSLI